MAKISRKQAEYLVAIGAAADFLTGQRVSTPVAKAINTALRRSFVHAAPPVARGLGSTGFRLGGTALGAARYVAMRHPYLTAGAVIYTAIKHRDEISDLAREGWEMVEDVAGQHQTAYQEIREERGRQPKNIFGLPAIGGRSTPSDRVLEGLGLKKKPKRRRSNYNNAVSKAMKAVKRSKFLGKPGTFTSPKRAFATVAKTVARVKKGAKVGTKGVSGVIKRAVGKIL